MKHRQYGFGSSCGYGEASNTGTGGGDGACVGYGYALRGGDGNGCAFGYLAGCGYGDGSMSGHGRSYTAVWPGFMFVDGVWREASELDDAGFEAYLFALAQLEFDV